tara:strand:- start:206 stop:754 length:549 start_codon:yes stop_codon:yes gene_type:complete
MALNPSVLSMGISAISAIGEHQTRNIQADMNAASQAYGNTMRKISTSQNLNAVTQNTIAVEDKARRLEGVLQQQSIKDSAAAEVNAAAAGVAGGSVQQTLLGLRRSALNAQNARMRNLVSAQFSADKQKSNIRLAGIMGEDISVLQRPSVASSLLGLGATLLDKYDNNQPKGSRSVDGARLW